MLPSLKINVPLLWGLCVLFSAASGTTSIPEAGMNFTVKPSGTTKQAATAHVEELQPTTLGLKTESAEVGAAAPKVTMMTGKNVDAVFSDKSHNSVSSTDGLVVVKTAATEATSISKPLGATVETSAKAEGQASHITTATHSPKHTTNRFHQPPVTSFTNGTVPAKESTATVVNSLSRLISATHPETTSGLTSTTAADALKTHRNWIQNLRNLTASAAEGTASPTSVPAVIRDTTETKMSTRTGTSNTTQSISATSVLNSTSQFPESAGPNSTSALIHDPTETKMSTTTGSSYTTQSISATSVLNSTSQFPESAGSNATSALIHDPTETVASTTTKHSHTSQSTSTISTLNSTSHFADPSRSNSTSADSLNSTATSTSSPAGILIPKDPRTFSGSTARPAPAITTALNKASETSPSNPVQPCSARSTVKQCLIIIAALAALATIFMVTTIVLCTKLSARKYKLRRPKQETEMMCISSLLPERSNTYVRQRNPISNGVMVFPACGDSDDEVGDNLTLSSFLPETA